MPPKKTHVFHAFFLTDKKTCVFHASKKTCETHVFLLTHPMCLTLILKNKTKQLCTEKITLCRYTIQRVMCFVFALRRSFQRKALVRTKRCSYFESEPLSSRRFSNILKPTRLARNLDWFLDFSYTIVTHVYSLNLPS